MNTAASQAIPDSNLIGEMSCVRQSPGPSFGPCSLHICALRDDRRSSTVVPQPICASHRAGDGRRPAFSPIAGRRSSPQNPAPAPLRRFPAAVS